MTHAEVATILRQFNAWRRGDCAPSEQPEPPEPYTISLAIDAAVAIIDRLDAAVTAWKETDKACRDLTEKVIPNLRESLGATESERDELRAKIAEMERQKPVGTALLCTRCSTPFDDNHYCPACGHHTATEEDVYALPGALGEEK